MWMCWWSSCRTGFRLGSFFTGGEELEPILGRKVDLVSKVGKYLWPSVKEDLTTIYKQVLP